MEWHGKVNFHKAITLEGKPHGIEHVPTLPTWQSSDQGRVIFTEDTDNVYVGSGSGWEELTPGGIGPHDHDDRYYTQTQTDLFFEGYNGGKAQVDWTNVVEKPSTFEPSIHGNEAHNPDFATVADISYETLNTNGAVGIGSDQLAIGSHNHDGDYEIVAPITTTLYVDGNREDSYTEDGSFTKPYKTITAALGVSESGQTVIVSAGTYEEDIVIPAGVSLISHSQVKVSIQGDVTFNGPGSPITIQGMIFTGSEKALTVNCTAHLFESYSYSRVVFGPNAHIQANVFNVNVNQPDVDAITFNGSGDCNLIASSVRAQGDAHAIVVNSGRLAFFNGEASSEENAKATIVANGGNVVLASSQIVNTTGGPAIDLSASDGTAGSPNAISGVIAVGNVICGNASTILDGVEFVNVGSLSGNNLRFRPSTQVGYNNTTSGLTSTNVQDALDELNSNKLNSSGGTVTGNILPDTDTITLGSETNKFGAVYAKDGHFDSSTIYLGTDGHAIKVDAGNLVFTNDGVSSFEILSSEDIDLDDYYSKVEIDNKFVTADQLSDDNLSPATAGYQEIELTGQSIGDESGLNGGEQYYFSVSVNGGSESEYSITPQEATSGYQELGLSGLEGETETGLDGGNQYSFFLNAVERFITTPSDDLATFGYQELGLSGLEGETETGLDGETTYNFRINNTDYDITTLEDTTWDDVLPLLNTETTGFTWTIEGGDIRVTNGTSGSVSTVDLESATEDDLFSSLTGFTDFETAYDGEDEVTHTTWDDVLPLLNAETTGFTWTIEGGDIRVTNDITGSASTVVMSSGATGDDFMTGVGANLGSSVNGQDAETTFSDIIDLMNTALLLDATWTWEDGNIRLTSDTLGESSSISIGTATSGTDIVNEFNGIVGLSTSVNGEGADTVVGASLVGVGGIPGLTPEGKSDGDPATLQEMLEAIVGRL